MKQPKPLNRRVAIVLALAAMWLMSSIGIFIVMHAGNWWFIGLHGYDLIAIGQVGAFFTAWAAAQIPGAYTAGFIIGSSDFSHPLRAAFWTMAPYEILLSVVRAFWWPWGALHDLNQSIPILAYLISVLLLIGASVFFAWFTPRFHGFVQKRFAQPSADFQTR